MKKLTALVKHLIDSRYQGRKLAKPEQFDCWIESGRIEPCSKVINSKGLLAARFYYSGVISINPCGTPVELLSAFISFYLQANAGTDDSTDVEFSNDPIDESRSEVELTIEQFVEDIELVETLDGPFLLNDKRYDFGEQSLWVAKFFTLDAQKATD